MDSLKKHGDPLENELRDEPTRNIDEVKSNQPGSKGRREEEDQEIVRSASKKPNPNQPSEDPSMRTEVDPNRPSNM
jgi:hypothetical protein